MKKICRLIVVVGIGPDNFSLGIPSEKQKFQKQQYPEEDVGKTTVRWTGRSPEGLNAEAPI